jgi:DNA-binding XRE family transcriptional regulator
MNATFWEKFGLSIRVARGIRGLTQEQLAKRVKLTRTSIVNIEQGRQKVLLDTAVLLGKELKVSLSKLID